MVYIYTVQVEKFENETSRRGAARRGGSSRGCASSVYGTVFWSYIIQFKWKSLKTRLAEEGPRGREEEIQEVVLDLLVLVLAVEVVFGIHLGHV